MRSGRNLVRTCIMYQLYTELLFYLFLHHFSSLTSPTNAYVFPKCVSVTTTPTTALHRRHLSLVRTCFSAAFLLSRLHSSVLFYRSLKAVNFYLPPDLEPGTGAPQRTKHQTAENINQSNKHSLSNLEDTDTSLNTPSIRPPKVDKQIFFSGKTEIEIMR